MKKNLVLLSMAIASLLALPLTSNSTSFDCSKATHPSEKLICNNPELSDLDDNLAQLFKSERSSSNNPEQLKSDQISWIKRVRECTEEKCIKDLYAERITQLTKQLPVNAPHVEPKNESAVINTTPESNSTAQPISVSNNETTVATSEISSTSKSKSTDDIAPVTFWSLTLGISLVSALIFAVINQAITRSRIKTTNGNRAVRDIGSGLGALGLAVFFSFFPSYVIATALLNSNYDRESLAISSLSIIIISLFFGRIFAVKEGGIVYDAANKIIEVPGGGSSMDSILSYLNPIRWFEFLRRITIPCDSITGISGETRFKTTTSYNKMTNSVNSNTSETHILTLITTNGEWNIKCGSRSKKSAMLTLVCEAADLDLIQA